MELKSNDYKSLVQLYSKLNEKNQLAKSSGMHDYSLLNALLNKNDEVHLHSNFIYSMINPNGSHYCENKFLKFFLEAINEDDFININSANVYKEKGKIDLLIEDGSHVLIIENKLRATDQKYQISRYIKYVTEKYFTIDEINIHQKIHILYLSEYKKSPSITSESTIGFKLDNKKLKWEGKAVSTEKLNLNFKHKKNVEINFNRVQHSKELLIWIKKSKKYLKDKSNSQSLIYAFNEYELILQRLKNNKWRKIMSLSEYTLELEDTEEEKMYAFMCEAKQKLNDYIVKKLTTEIDKLFPRETREKLIFGNTIFKDFTNISCQNWVQKDGTSNTYKDIGFLFNKKYFFALGKDNIAYGSFEKGWKKNIKTNRNKLQQNNDKNLFQIIDDLQQLAKENN